METGRVEPERWWRVEVNQAGNVASCEAVEHVHRNTRTVLYIRAICREDALEEALRWLERRRSKARAYQSQWRAKRRRQGICQRCTKVICKDSASFCRQHLLEERDYSRNQYHIRKAPQGPVAAKPTPEEMMLREQTRTQRYRRMAVQLPVVLAVFDQVDGRLASAFRAWLIDEIAQRGGADRQAAE